VAVVLVEEVFKTGSEKDEIKKKYRVYSLNSFYCYSMPPGIRYQPLSFLRLSLKIKAGPLGYWVFCTSYS
jgi:hypothetical protein